MKTTTTKFRLVLISMVLMLLVSVFLAAPVQANPGTVYVDGTQGNDGAGCGTGPGASACKTIQYAITNIAVAGDTVQVAAGTYTQGGSQLLINKSITVRAEPGLPVRPKIVFNYGNWNNCNVQIAADNVVFEGFEVDNSAHWGSAPRGYLVGDYNNPRNGWTIRNCDIHHGRNAIRPRGNNVTIEYNNLHETESDLINCEYGACYGLKVSHNWLHSHHQDMGGKPAGLTYNVSSTPGADVEVTYNYVWACRTFIDFQTNGGLAPANHILVAHNTVDYWIGDLMNPVDGENAQQMSIAWWMYGAATPVDFWNCPNFEIRDNIFSRQRWYAVVNTDNNSDWSNGNFFQGQLVLNNNLFWQWYLRNDWYPVNAYPNEWPAARGAVGWANPYLGSGNGFVMNGCLTGDPLYAATGTNPDQYYALRCGSPAYHTASDGTNIGAWQGTHPNITLSPATLPNGTAGTAYDQTLAASGGTAPYTFAVTAGTLPPGLTLESNGQLHGTPTAVGTFNFTVTATDANNCTGSQAYTMTVTVTLLLSPATLPKGTVGTAYNQTLTASGGTAPYTFAVTAGTLPPGLTLSASGVLSGTPTAAGTFTFTVTATDANGYTGSQTYTITIVKLAPVGGFLVPVNMVEVLAPWLGLVALAVVMGAIVTFRKRRV